MHLSHEYWLKHNIDPKISFYTACNVIFGVPKYAEILTQIANEKRFNVHLDHTLVQVKGKERIAVFKNNKTNALIETPFDILHAPSPQRPPDFLLNNSKGITNSSGYVEIDNSTLRSIHKPNVWAAGDCISAPNSKTAAAVTGQIPVLVHNVLETIDHPEIANCATYGGYSSCPLLVGSGKVLLAEFKYGGVLDETFPLLQNKPRKAFGYLKSHIFPFAYFHLMPKGMWYGRSGIFKPKLNFLKDQQTSKPKMA